MQPGFLPFWREVEDAINNVLREYFVEGNPNLKLVIDDFKVVHVAGKGSDRCGLKENQHVHDNRRGFTQHQLVLSASQALVGIRCDGIGDTTSSSMTTLIRGQIMPSVGPNSSHKLIDASFFMDRGYAGLEPICALAIQHGGDIEVATARRMADNVLTYDQSLKPTDKRVLIDKSGHKQAYRYHCKPDGSSKKISALGYVDGNNSAVLGFSTVHHLNHWDLVL